MVKKNILVMLAAVMILGLNVSDAYAKEYNIDGIMIEINEESILLPPDENYSSDEKHSTARGTIISYGFGSVDNDGNGDMTFMIETYTHVPCDEIRHKAYIEVWNDADESWETLDGLLFVEKKEDHPDDLLISLTSSFTIKDLKQGHYYRLSGSHLVKLDGRVETLSTRTDGVMNNH